MREVEPEQETISWHVHKGRNQVVLLSDKKRDKKPVPNARLNKHETMNKTTTIGEVD